MFSTTFSVGGDDTRGRGAGLVAWRGAAEATALALAVVAFAAAGAALAPAALAFAAAGAALAAGAGFAGETGFAADALLATGAAATDTGVASVGTFDFAIDFGCVTFFACGAAGVAGFAFAAAVLVGGTPAFALAGLLMAGLPPEIVLVETLPTPTLPAEPLPVATLADLTAGFGTGALGGVAFVLAGGAFDLVPPDFTAGDFATGGLALEGTIARAVATGAAAVAFACGFAAGGFTPGAFTAGRAGLVAEAGLIGVLAVTTGFPLAAAEALAPAFGFAGTAGGNLDADFTDSRTDSRAEFFIVPSDLTKIRRPHGARRPVTENEIPLPGGTSRPRKRPVKALPNPLKPPVVRHSVLRRRSGAA